MLRSHGAVNGQRRAAVVLYGVDFDPGRRLTIGHGPSHRRLTRRNLLKATAAAGAGFVILRDSASARTYQANERLNLAHVGCGGRGKELLGSFSQQANVAAMCDVNDAKSREMYERFPDSPKFHDFRRMLEEVGDRIDAVVVATPDHTHAVATAVAIRQGKPVYTEKPLSRTVGESRALRALAAERKVATSMGNQGTAAGPFRRALELIRGGAIGEVREVHVWNDGGGAGHTKPPPEEAPKPEWLQWDLWLGPAADRPYRSRWLNWHQWRDFGTGNLGNWASHTANLAFMALNVDALWRPAPAGDQVPAGDQGPAGPVLRVEAKVQEINRLSFPRWETITWQVPPRGGLPAVPFHWYNGGRAPGVREKLEALAGRGLDWGDKGRKKWDDFAGCVIVGTEGKVHASGHNATFTLLPEEKFAAVQKDRPEELPASRGHERDWLLACRGGPPAWAGFDYAAPLNEFLQLGNLATQFDAPIDYDPLTGRVANNPEADAALRGTYRDGWSL